MVAMHKMAANIIIICLVIGAASSVPRQSMLQHLFRENRPQRPIIIMLTNIDHRQLKELLAPRYRNHLAEPSHGQEVMMIKPKKGKDYAPKETMNWLFHNDPRSRYLYKAPSRPTLGDEFIPKKKATKLPILKELLRLSNNAQCNAKNECQSTCSNNYDGQAQNNCVQKCEVKYDCQQSSQEDSCALGDCYNSNECNDDTCQPSTKGILLEPEQNKCKRC